MEIVNVVETLGRTLDGAHVQAVQDRLPESVTGALSMLVMEANGAVGLLRGRARPGIDEMYPGAALDAATLDVSLLFDSVRRTLNLLALDSDAGVRARLGQPPLADLFDAAWQLTDTGRGLVDAANARRVAALTPAAPESSAPAGWSMASVKAAADARRDAADRSAGSPSVDAGGL